MGLMLLISYTSDCIVFNELSLHEGVEFLFLLDGFQFKLEKELLPKSLKYIGIQNIVVPLTKYSISDSVNNICLIGYSFPIIKEIFNENVVRVGFGKLPTPIDINEIPSTVKQIRFFDYNHRLSEIPLNIEGILLANIEIPIDKNSFSNLTTQNEIYLTFDGYTHKITDNYIPDSIKRVIISNVFFPIDHSFKNTNINYLHFNEYPFKIDPDTIPAESLSTLIFGKTKYPLESGSIPIKRLKPKAEIKFLDYNHVITKEVFPIIHPNAVPGGIYKLSFHDIGFPLQIYNGYSYPFIHLYIWSSKHRLNNQSVIRGKNLHIGNLTYALNVDSIPLATHILWVYRSYKHKITADIFHPGIKSLNFNDYSLEYTIPQTVLNIQFSRVKFVTGVNNEIPDHVQHWR